MMHSYDYYFSFNYFGHCIKILQKISWKLSVWTSYPPLRLVLESLALSLHFSVTAPLSDGPIFFDDSNILSLRRIF